MPSAYALGPSDRLRSVSNPKDWHGITRRVYGIAAGVWHHALACILLRIDYIQHFVLIPYRRQAADFIHGFAVIFELHFCTMSTTKTTPIGVAFLPATLTF